MSRWTACPTRSAERSALCSERAGPTAGQTAESRCERPLPEDTAIWPAARILDRLLSAYGDQHWWPAESALEVLVGAILTQAVRWQNVVIAIERLKAAGPLSEEGLLEMPREQLNACLRPTRFPNQKASRLLAVLTLITAGKRRTLGGFFATSGIDHRQALLSVPGVGAETADAILLYAGDRRAFPVDAYTRRIAQRTAGNVVTDHQVREQTLAQLPSVEQLAQLHGLLVVHGQRHCHLRPRCSGCPLGQICASVELGRTA